MSLQRHKMGQWGRNDERTTTRYTTSSDPFVYVLWLPCAMTKGTELVPCCFFHFDKKYCYLQTSLYSHFKSEQMRPSRYYFLGCSKNFQYGLWRNFEAVFLKKTFWFFTRFYIQGSLWIHHCKLRIHLSLLITPPIFENGI